MARQSEIRAWTLGIIFLAMYGQLPDNPDSYKHSRVRTAHQNHRLDAYAPQPQLPEDEVATDNSGFFDTTAKDVELTPPTRYSMHQVEVWSGSQKQVIAVYDTASSPKSTGSSPYLQAIATPIASLPNNMYRYARTVTVSNVQPMSVQTAQFTAGKAAVKSNNRFLAHGNSVSDDFQSEIADALATIPQNYVSALEKKGYRVVLSQKLTDVIPAVGNQQVRGYERSETWNSVYGMFNRRTKRIVMAELAEKNLHGQSSYVPLNDRQRRLGIVRHEFGHAMDQYLGNYSHSKQFMDAYNKDAQALPASERETVNYFLQSGSAGAEETFAELFACLNGQGCDPKQDDVLRNHFGDLLSLIQQRISSIRG